MSNNRDYKDIDERINQLYGNVETKPKVKELSNEEKQKIRKEMLVLLIVTVTAAFFILIITFNPFYVSTNTNTNNNSNNNNNELQLTIGEIDINHRTVKKLSQQVQFSVIDLYYVNTLEYFKNDITNTSELSNELKMHLIEKNNLFVDLLVDSGLMEYVETCSESGLEISKEKFEEVVHKTLGPTVTINEDFSKTLHYTEIQEISRVLFTKKGEKYFITCNGPLLETNLNKYSSQVLTKAIVIDGGIELYYNVVFVSDNKVYRDYNCTELITESKDTDYDTYIQKGSVYKYTFIKDIEDSYYLTKIEKQTN